jgi:hypothetical protein
MGGTSVGARKGQSLVGAHKGGAQWERSWGSSSSSEDMRSY